jgi:hypothetical protein
MIKRCQYCDEEYEFDLDRDRASIDMHLCWFQYMNRWSGLCGLCGNSGWIDTIGKVASHAGIRCGIRVPCVCPNGRSVNTQLPENHRTESEK